MFRFGAGVVAVASFSAPEAPVQNLLLISLTRSSDLRVGQHRFNGHCPGKAVAARNVRRAATAGEQQALACGPQREIFGRTRRAVLKFCVARSKARSFESMLVPYINSLSICVGGGFTRALMSGQFAWRRMIYASTNATKVIPETTLSLDKFSSNFSSSSL